MFRLTSHRYVVAASAAVLALGLTTSASAQKYGKPGDPVTLTVGYQPYYTQAWSALVMEGKELWKKKLPPGSKVTFQVGLQGAIIVGQMLAGKQDIGYMGDMPSMNAVSRPEVADLRIVANLGLSQSHCNVFFVKKDAPEFKDPIDAVKWMAGKRVATPHGSCTDRFARLAFETLGVKPKDYLNQNIEVMSTNFQAGKLDAGITWEPPASDLIEKGIARRVASGANFKADDAGFLVFNYELMKTRPDVLRGWMEAELDAQLWVADSKNAAEMTKLAKERTTGMSELALWKSHYWRAPNSMGGHDVKDTKYYALHDNVKKLMSDGAAFLHKFKKLPKPSLRPEAFDDSVARAILKERGLTSPVAIVKGQPESAFPLKK